MVVFTQWLRKYGQTTRITQNATTYFVDIACKRVMRQNTITRSLRTKFERKRLVHSDVFVKSIITPKPPRSELIMRITQLENQLASANLDESVAVEETPLVVRQAKKKSLFPHF